MSLATAALRRPATPAGPSLEPAPHIELVPPAAGRRARPRVLYAGVVVGGLGALMLSQLLLSIALSDGAYTIDALQTERKEQARAVQQLTEDLGRLSSPQNLAANAEALGMVQNTNPVWLRMSDGAVIGTPAPAAGAGVLAASGSQVANDLLTGVPLVTVPAAGAEGAQALPGQLGAPAPATPEQAAGTTAPAELPLLAAPTTR
ncbi:hypothetical protein [Naasia sp. SYSU D00948]|uniref:hypothetical protein n=1 Tax=Naasia sp. SYSU D00948 TaxID=2817379 RepID=UPI001B30E7A1|nr:hypothetical protein [Naasia sp. SYSU D00948]